MKYWVFRVPKSNGGSPDNLCPINLKIEAISIGLEAPQSIINNYSNCLDYALDELFGKNESNRKRLRQGWGVPTLDLRLPESVWIENYISACYKYWNVQPSDNSCEQASGRRKILIHMNNMETNDVIFLPNVKTGRVDENYFTICRVKKEYYFEDRSQYRKNSWEQDFGHVIEVKDLVVFKFNQSDTLNKSIFGAPYLHAIDPIKINYVSYPEINSFIEEKYYPKHSGARK